MKSSSSASSWAVSIVLLSVVSAFVFITPIDAASSQSSQSSQSCNTQTSNKVVLKCDTRPAELANLSSSELAKGECEWKPPKGYDDPNFMTPLDSVVLSYVFVGFGSQAISTQLNHWITMFKDYYDLTNRWVYILSGRDYDEDMLYLNARNGVFMTSERYMNATLRALWPNNFNFPLVVQPLVMSYNVSNVTTYSFDPINECVRLSMELIAKIYLGEITNWRDPQILEANPQMLNFLWDQTIIPIGYNGRETSTIPFIQALWDHSATFRKYYKTPPAYWPVGVPGAKLNPNLRLVSNAYASFADLINLPGGLSYMNYNIWKSSGGAYAPYVLIYEDGMPYEVQYLLKPNNTAVMAAYQNTHLDEFNVIQGINTSISGVYPLSTVTYIHYSENSTLAHCNKDFYVWRFIRWIMLYSQPQTDGNLNGFITLPKKIRTEIVKRMEGIYCLNDTTGPILRTKIVNDHDVIYFDVLLAFDIAAWVLFVVTGVVICVVMEILTDKKKQMSPVVFYTVFLLVGASILYLSNIFFYIVPDSDSICQLRVWTSGIGASIMLGGLFGRLNTLYYIFRVQNSKKMKVDTTKNMRRRSIMDFFISIGLSLAIQITILVIWTIKDPLVAKFTVIDDVQRVERWVCKCDQIWLWFGLEIGFCMVLMAYGLYVCLRSLEKSERFLHARWLMVAIYNVILGACALVPILATITVTDANLYIVHSAAVIFEVSQILFLTYLPKFSEKLSKAWYSWRGTTTSDTFTGRTTASKQAASSSKNSGSDY